jgi:glutathione peroxidase-family protein
VVDVVMSVARHFRRSRVRFIHVEVYEGNDPSRGYNRWMQQWHLTTEPWTFVVDRRGRVSSRFQGAVSATELERAVQRVAG